MRSSRNQRAISLVLDPFLEFSDLPFRQDGSARPGAIVVDLPDVGKGAREIFSARRNPSFSRFDFDRGDCRSSQAYPGASAIVDSPHFAPATRPLALDVEGLPLSARKRVLCFLSKANNRVMLRGAAIIDLGSGSPPRMHPPPTFGTGPFETRTEFQIGHRELRPIGRNRDERTNCDSSSGRSGRREPVVV